MLSLSTLGVILSVYGSILAASASPSDWWTLVRNDLGPREVDLSRVISSSSTSAINKDGKDLYVFALDVSGSMREEQINGSDFQEILKKFADTGLPISPECLASLPRPSLTRLDLARAEVCTFLGQVPEGAYASLWKFASTPKLMSEKNAEFSRDPSNLETLKN